MDKWVIGQESPEAVIERIIREVAILQQRPVVCIDYFDTLVTRTIIPEHTKIIASAALSRLLPGACSGDELYSLRRQLELELVDVNARNNGELDFCLRDFANRFWLLLHDRGLTAAFRSRNEFVAAILAIETAVEKSVQIICPDVLRVVEGLRQKGLELILVSDFYLPQECFAEILAHFGFRDIFSRVYISSSHRRSKGAGTIYPKIAEDCGCPVSNLLMIGDNPHADVAMAEKNGLQTLLVDRSEVKAVTTENSPGKRENGTGAENRFGNVEIKALFGEMACSLWLFVHRLFNELWRSGVRDVFFLSKEGEFLQRLFILYQHGLFGRELIRPHYLVASRKSTFLPSLRRLEDEDFSRLLAHYRDLSIMEFLRSLNFTSDLVERICGQLPFECGTRISELQKSIEFEQLLSLPLFAEEYETLRTTQRRNFIQYLDSFDLPIRNEGFHLVDVGWKGSIQDNIFHLLDRSTTIHGYYIGSFNATGRCDNNRKKGLLFDNFPDMSPFFQVYNNNRSLFEMLLGATHGSADCYLMENEVDRYRRLTEHLQTKTVIACAEGRLHILVRDLPDERMLFNNEIVPLQTEMERVFIGINHAYLHEYFQRPDNEWFARRHARMVFRPRREEIDYFQNLYHLENFGIFEYTRFSATYQHFLQRLKNLYRLAADPGILESGIWPPVVLRRLGLGPLCRFDGMRRHVKTFYLDNNKPAVKESVVDGR